MGFEMDLRATSAEDEAVVTRVTAWYKANRAWMMGGRFICWIPTIPP